MVPVWGSMTIFREYLRHHDDSIYLDRKISLALMHEGQSLSFDPFSELHVSCAEEINICPVVVNFL